MGGNKKRVRGLKRVKGEKWAGKIYPRNGYYIDEKTGEIKRIVK